MLREGRFMKGDELRELCQIFLDHHRVVLEEKVVEVFWNKVEER